MEEKLQEQAIAWKSLSGFLFEPILGVGGVRTLHPSAYEIIAAKCRQADSLVIADETATGFGRTGVFLASERLEPKPDILCLGKAITNGEFPLSATLLSGRVWNMLENSSDDEREKYLYGSTYAGHPSGCLAALKVIELIDEPLLAGVNKKGQWLEEKLKVLREKHPALVKEVRGCGLMWAIELPTRALSCKACFALLKRGVRVAAQGESLVIMPPFIISYDELEFAVNTISEVLSSLTYEMDSTEGR